MILTAASDVDRPIFYSVAVIIAGYLPIYALTGPPANSSIPWPDTMGFALLGALILTLTLVPVLASIGSRAASRTKQNPVYDWIRDNMRAELNGASITPAHHCFIAC